MNVDTDTFAALTAETTMLREHSRRGRQPGRHRAARARQPWRPLDGYWWGGHAAAMEDVIRLAHDVIADTDSPGRALRAVCELAAGVVELQETHTVPGGWSDQ